MRSRFFLPLLVVLVVSILLFFVRFFSVSPHSVPTYEPHYEPYEPRCRVDSDCPPHHVCECFFIPLCPICEGGRLACDCQKIGDFDA